MRKFYIFIVLTLPLSSLAGAVLWNRYEARNLEVIIEQSPYTAPGGEAGIYSGRDPASGLGFISYLGYSYKMNRSGTQIEEMKPNLCQMPAAGDNIWLVMYAGEVVTQDSFADSARLFLRLDNDCPEGAVGGGIKIEDGGHYYFGVVTSAYDDSDESTTLFGWVELIADGDKMHIGNSVLGLEGQSLTVGADYSTDDYGAVPEPSAGLLLLVGLAGLGLRRGREVEN